MRDDFYHWLAVALLFAMFFGAPVARAADGRCDWFLLVSYGLIGVAASIGAIDSCRKKESA